MKILLLNNKYQIRKIIIIAKNCKVMISKLMILKKAHLELIQLHNKNKLHQYNQMQPRKIKNLHLNNNHKKVINMFLVELAEEGERHKIK